MSVGFVARHQESLRLLAKNGAYLRWLRGATRGQRGEDIADFLILEFLRAAELSGRTQVSVGILVPYDRATLAHRHIERKLEQARGPVAFAVATVDVGTPRWSGLVVYGEEVD